MRFGQEVIHRWRALRRWAANAKPLWWTLAGLVAFILGPYNGLPILLPVDPVGRLRISGAALQIAGIASVAVGLHRSRQLFERPGLWKTFTSWMGELAPVFRGSRTIVGQGSIEDAFDDIVDGRASVAPGNNTPLEDRVAHLEEQFADFRRQIHADVRQVEQSLQTGLSEEEQERSKEDQELGRQLEEAVIGGIHIELAGLIYLIFGVVLGTIPELVTCVLGL